jgi:hypothetical protein
MEIGDHLLMCKKEDALLSWERHLARLNDMLTDLPDGADHELADGVLKMHTLAVIQVTTRRNKLFPQEK